MSSLKGNRLVIPGILFLELAGEPSAIDGESDLLAAERLLQNVEIHPHLSIVLDGIMPDMSLVNGTPDMDESFSMAVEKLGVQRFKRKGSVYLFFYLTTLVDVKRYLDAKAVVELPVTDVFSKVIALFGRELLDDGREALASTFGMFRAAEFFEGIGPDSGTEKIDFKAIRKVAEDFIVGSLANPRITELAQSLK